MATETIVTNQKYRILTDQFNRIWHRISFWTVASDVWFKDGRNAEDKITYEIKKLRDEIMKYLTADNGKIFQFGSKVDESGDLEYGHWIDGVFKPFGSSKYGACFTLPDLGVTDSEKSIGVSTELTFYCGHKCKVTGKAIFTCHVGTDSETYVKIFDKSNLSNPIFSEVIKGLPAEHQIDVVRPISVTFLAKHTYQIILSAYGYGNGSYISRTRIEWDKPWEK